MKQIQLTKQREPVQPKIKVNETSEEDEKERQVEEAKKQQVTEKDIETTKEDDRETQIIPTTVPATSGSQSVSIQGTIKWEKKKLSSRVTKKPDRLGNNMISKVEATSSQEEESLPSV